MDKPGRRQRLGGQIPEAIIREVRRAANIVEIVSEVVALRQTGRNLVGLCPFHSEADLSLFRLR